jgi:hypothetical protein
MGNLFRLNPLFELELGVYPEKFNPNPTILQKAKSMEYLFFTLSKPNDFVVLSEKVDPYFEDYSKKKFNSTGEFSSSKGIFSQSSNLVEWGKFHSIDQDGYTKDDIEKIKISKLLNSKISQIQIYNDSDRLHSLLLDSKTVLQNPQYPLLFKPDLSFSGIQHKILFNQEEWTIFQKKNNINGVLQEYKNRVLDFSFLYDFDETSIQYFCSTEMQINEKNTYLSSKISKKSSLESILQMNSLEFTVLNEKIIELVKDFLFNMKMKYRGPLSVDGFVYKEKNSIDIREISEINFRYTMGRILYEISKKYPENKEHTLVTISSKDYKNMSEVNLFDLEYRVKLQFEVQNQMKVKTCILLTPPFLAGKLVSSCVVYYGT